MWRASEFAGLGLLVVILGAPAAWAQTPSTPNPAPPPKVVDIAPSATANGTPAAIRAAPVADPRIPAASPDDPVHLKPLTRDIWTMDDRDAARRHAFDGANNRYGLPPAALPLGWKVPF